MGRPKGSKNKPKTPLEADSLPRRGRPPKDNKSPSVASKPATNPIQDRQAEIRTGLFIITAARPWKIISGPVAKFTDVKKAREALAKARDLEKLEGRNPYEIVLLPLGPKNEGLLP